MKVLALETSGDACSCALWVDGAVYQEHRLAPRRHAELILTMAEAVLAAGGAAVTDLDALAFGRGPGTFTGVRVAAAVAQGVAVAADLPVVPVSSLRALAEGLWRERRAERVAAAFDARMDEVYWGLYALVDGHMEAAGAEAVAAPGAVAVPAAGRWLGAGRGWGDHREALGLRLGERLAGVAADVLPQAWDVAVLGALELGRGGAVDAADALPVYLRDRVIQHPAAP